MLCFMFLFFSLFVLFCSGFLMKGTAPAGGSFAPLKRGEIQKRAGVKRGPARSAHRMNQSGSTRSIFCFWRDSFAEDWKTAAGPKGPGTNDQPVPATGN